MAKIDNLTVLEPENPGASDVDKILTRGVDVVWGAVIRDPNALKKMKVFIKDKIKANPHLLAKVQRLADHHAQLARLFDLDREV